MPEGLEAEIWRRALEVTVGRTIERVWVDERVAPRLLVDVLPGTSIVTVERCGKVIRIATDGPSVGLHLGMTGRVVVDGAAPIERLAYASGADRPEWDRLRLFTAGASPGGAPAVRMNDPRRLGRVSIDPGFDHLGVDMFDVDVVAMGSALSGRRLAVKTALLDQGIVAGLGNLCADEVLWWASIAPHRSVATLSGGELDRLVDAIRSRLPVMLRAGGSTTGVLDPAVRAAGGPCPRDGAGLERSVIGGRTAVWCAQHQH